MKDSKEKEHRISNLKDMINNVKEDPIESYDDIEEDNELINYLNEDTTDYDGLEIDDEFIYHPGDEKNYAIDLEENPIDEEFIIKTPNAKEIEKNDELEELGGDIAGDVSENFDNVINAKIGGKPILAIISTVLGIILIGISIFIFESRSDRVVDNVVSGETNFIFVIFLIFGILFLIYGVYKLLNLKNPLDSITKSIDSIDDDKKEENAPENTDQPSEHEFKETPLDKESYKIGEFDMGELKESFKKPTPSENKVTFKENLDNIPLAKEKPAAKKPLSEEEIEEIEYKKAQLEGESIDDIFSEVDDIK